MNGAVNKSIALTMDDLTNQSELKFTSHMMEQKKEKNSTSTPTTETGVAPVRNMYKLILEGKMPFDETAYEF